MKKNTKKFAFFLVCSIFVLISCSKTVENCKIRPDYEKIGESAIENKENLSETELKSAQINCKFWNINKSMNNKQYFCLNCGHEAHCDEKCYQNYGESEKTLCCSHCRCEKSEKSQFLDEDSFNGA